MCHVEREYNLRIFHFVFYTQTSLDLEKLCLTPNVYRKLIWSGIHNCMIIHPLGVVSSSSVLHDCLTAKQCVSILQDRCALSCNIVPIFQDNNFYTHTPKIEEQIQKYHDEVSRRKMFSVGSKMSFTSKIMVGVTTKQTNYLK